MSPLEPLVGGGSVVWVANAPDDAWLRATYDAERATAMLVPASVPAAPTTASVRRSAA